MTLTMHYATPTAHPRDWDDKASMNDTGKHIYIIITDIIVSS